MNVNCNIYESKHTISDTAAIHGYLASMAQTYAETYGRSFVALGVEDAEIVSIMKATCNSDGYIEYYSASYDITWKEKNAKALGHSVMNGKCERCGLTEDIVSGQLGGFCHMDL